MKTKTLKRIMVAIAAIGATFATQAKDLQDLRIYINPGHGGFESGDRHLGTVKHGAATYTDTCGFYETNTNLWKGLACVQRLIDYGFKFDPSLNPFPADFKGYVNPNGIQTNGDENFLYGAARDLSQGVVMSHVKTGFSRNINEIAKEVEANNFDLFLSIHSNAASEGASTNYPGMFIRGENRQESVPGSLDFALKCWPYAFANTHSQWTNYSMTNPGYYYDIDFWSGDYALTDHGNGNIVKGYYAVLRHNVPGYLMEGYFHTYQPARHRAMNPDVCAIEGEAYAHGIADYFGIEKETTGDLYGIVRDQHERFSHTYYKAPSNSPDAYLPINNATVKLKDATGNVVATYLTDDEYNGAFVFRKLQPGKYYIEVEAEGYKPADEIYCGPFEVVAADAIYPVVWIENVDYVPPTAEAADYVDEINTPAILMGESYNFTQAVADKEISQLEGKTIRRVIAKNNYIYVMAKDADAEPYVYILDPVSLDVVTEVSTEGMEGTYGKMGDMQVTNDGVLVATAVQLNFSDEGQLEGDEVMGAMNFYKWANDDKGVPTGKPEVVFATAVCGNYYRGMTGFTFAYTGNLTEGIMYLPSYSTYYDRKLRLNVLDIADGKVTSSRYDSTIQPILNMDTLGDDVTFSISPLNSASFIVNSSNVAPMQFNTMSYEFEGTSDVNYAGREGYFKFAGHSLMATADMDENGEHGGVILYDITKGIHKATDVQTANTALEGVTTGSFAAAGRTLVSYDSDDNIVAGNIDLYTFRDNKVSRFTTVGTQQDIVRGNFAYGLKSEKDGDMYALTFSLTGDADACVQLVSVEDGTVVELAAGSYEQGENTVTVDPATFEGSYNWRVVVDNPVVPTVNKIFDGGFASSGVAIDLNTESDLFGNIYVSCYDAPRHVEGYAADFSTLAISPMMSNANGNFWDTSVGASPWRLAVLPTSKLLISDWGDKQGGLYLFDPANPEAGRSNFFAGTCNPASGEWTYDGQVIGGSTASMQALGTGEETRLVSFQEDWPSDYKLNLVEYAIGTTDQINFQPTQSEVFANITRYLANGNVDLNIREKGWAFGQVRGSGNNTPGVPVFLLTDAEGNIVFNSGEDMPELDGGVGLIGLSEDASTFLFQNSGSTITVCELSWEPEFSLKQLYSFNVLETGGSSVNSFQCAFDPAGNIYIANRSSFRAFALPRQAAQAVTPAKVADILVGDENSVEAIGTDNNVNAPVRYYNLQGVEMHDANLAPGVYVRVQGNNTSKVVVK
ncbi:MAG: carboxypeptidase regulatory-like domain-containing protein [Muribaculaceae bacterium]|nr:carboxypeptidase regulatory-like domain-containing protein [Muribaculaceae bacterium]